MKRISIAIMASVICACSQDAALERRSVSSVLRSSEALSGQRIWICGVAHVGFEHTAIYESLESVTAGDAKSIWLNIDPARFQDLNMKEVEVVGIFNGKKKGHMSQFDGEMVVETIAPMTAGGCNGSVPDRSARDAID